MPPAMAQPDFTVNQGVSSSFYRSNVNDARIPALPVFRRVARTWASGLSGLASWLGTRYLSSPRKLPAPAHRRPPQRESLSALSSCARDLRTARTIGAGVSSHPRRHSLPSRSPAPAFRRCYLSPWINLNWTDPALAPCP